MVGTEVRMPQMAVYYPYIHFRNPRWLKVAALYWPRMVRIVDSDYPTRNSDLVKALQDELEFVVDHSPAAAADAIAVPFSELVNTAPRERVVAWRLPSDLGYQDPREFTEPQAPRWGADGNAECVPELEHYGPSAWAAPELTVAERIRSGALAGVHRTEVAGVLAHELMAAGLAMPARGDWFAMHPELAWIYKCRLTEELARRNNLVATTDQLAAHAALSGPLDLGEPSGGVLGPGGAQGIAETFGLLCVTSVVPRNLSHVPVEKIIEVRKRFGGEFDRWRAYVDAVGNELADQLCEVESPQILQTYLSDAARRYAAAPVQDLRRGLADVGIEVTSLAVNSKFELPAGLAATGLLVEPHVALAGGVALGALSLRRAARARAQSIRAHPAAYLLSVQETLAPKTWLSRTVQAVRRAAGLAG